MNIRNETKMKQTVQPPAGRPSDQRCRLLVRHHWMRLWALLLLASCILPGGLLADEKEPVPLALLKFGTGIISAYALHEAGHALAASLTDTHIEWGVGSYNQPLGFTEWAENDTDGMILHSAGLVTQVATSEVILQSDSIDKNDTFVRGMMAWNVFNPIVYALDYWFFHKTNQKHGKHYQGDIQGVEHYSSAEDANLFAAVITVLTAYQGYRYIKTQTWAPDWMKHDQVRFTCEPTTGMGVQLMMHIDF
jgi:hypothetical protein